MSGLVSGHIDGNVGGLSLDAEALYRDLLRDMQQLVSTHEAIFDAPPLLVGIASGGAWLAERLQADLKLAGKPGTLSSAMHRDDFSKRGLAPGGQTLLPFDVNGAHLVVVRVRVEFSKNRLKTLLPRSSGTFLTSRSLTLTKLAAMSRMCVKVALGNPSVDSK